MSMYNDTLAREILQFVATLVVVSSLVMSIYLFIVRKKFRLYLVPVLLLLPHSLMFCAAFVMRDAGWMDIPWYFIRDWAAIFLFHNFTTIAVYIIWMPLLRR